ncbi:MAG TPA: pyridoxamine 5'-phosphate oxidase family protein, partial [Magnetospirillaceae bacterium]|nr:pyridoxamine 5'-phosphate oxidase family protein [Magnetospirillaceae bacterium]
MSPWHEGELVLQRSIGVDEALSDIGAKVVRPYLTEQHRDFFPQLPFAVLGTVDPSGDVWATLRAGRPGFLSSPDPERLDLALRPESWDPAEAGIQDGLPIALLGIQLTTRRRNRLNGPVKERTSRGFSIAVGQSFGNCPKYITLRGEAEPAEESVEPPQKLERLDQAARRMIAEAKTFFVASYATG